MKKFMSVALVSFTCALALTGCQFNKKTEVPNNTTNNNTNNTPPVQEEVVKTDPIRDDFVFDDAMEALENELENVTLKELSEEEIEQRYSFGKYKGLEKYAASSITEDSITEIIMVKLGDNEQTSEIMSKFLQRIEKLKNEYAENEKIMAILNSQETIVKQQGDVAVMIIAENARELEAEYDEMFKQESEGL